MREVGDSRGVRVGATAGGEGASRRVEGRRAAASKARVEGGAASAAVVDTGPFRSSVPDAGGEAAVGARDRVERVCHRQLLHQRARSVPQTPRHGSGGRARARRRRRVERERRGAGAVVVVLVWFQQQY